jgi:hypothetical protein
MLWRICAETHKRSTNSQAILRICGSLSCISNTSAAAIAVKFARRLAACIKCTHRQEAAIGYRGLTTLRTTRPLWLIESPPGCYDVPSLANEHLSESGATLSSGRRKARLGRHCRSVRPCPTAAAARSIGLRPPPARRCGGRRKRSGGNERELPRS